MLRIKLARTGRKKTPHFRILVLEGTKDPFGDYLENVGHFNPRTKEIVLKTERIQYWMSQGAQPTDSVHNILVEQGVITDAKKRNVSALGRKEKKKIADAKAKETEARAAAKAEKLAAQEKKEADATAENTTPEAVTAEETK